MSNIPADLDVIFQELKTEIIWLHGRWKIYRQLFAHSEDRIHLLNECAPVFFYIMQDDLVSDVQVTLCKLTDPARKGKFDNLSLDQLQTRVEAQGEHQLAATLRNLLDDLHAKCQPFRRHRNKRLSHLDLSTVMQSSSSSLPDISRRMIEDALEVVRNYMNVIEMHYDQFATGYQHFFMVSDGDALVSMLKYGLRYQELQQEGKLSWSDWEDSKWKNA